MFNSKEIAERALLHAKEVRREKQKRMKAAGIAFGMCIAVLAAASPLLQRGSSEPIMQIEDEPVPLIAPGIIVTGGDNATIPADALNLEIALLGSEFSSNWLTFELLLQDTKETLYTSDMIAPFEKIGDIVLQKPLKKGEYAAELTVSAYKSDRTTVICTESLNLTLIAHG